MKALILSLLLAVSATAQDLSFRVRQEILDQTAPVTVNVSMKGFTTLQFPEPIQALDGKGFTQKPGKEEADFCFVPGLNWVSVYALKPNASQNLSVVIDGKVYEVMLVTQFAQDLSVIFRFGRTSLNPSQASAQ